MSLAQVANTYKLRQLHNPAVGVDELRDALSFRLAERDGPSNP